MRETLFTFIIHCEPLFNQDPRYDETCGFASIFLAGPAFKADSYFCKVEMPHSFWVARDPVGFLRENEGTVFLTLNLVGFNLKISRLPLQQEITMIQIRENVPAPPSEM